MKKIIKRLFKKDINGSKQFKKSYSQDGEDMLLSSFLDDLGGRDRGYYIDVGALHPFRFSNTAHFYDRGWNGINIEPTPNAIKLFEKHRTRDINLNIGIGGQHEKLIFYCFDEPALNSFSKELSEHRDKNTVYKIIETIEIPIYTLEYVLDKYLPAGQHIDFINIDVEGLDLEVLKSNNWEKYRPDFIFAEDIINFVSLEKSEVYNYLTQQKYELLAKTQRTMLFKSLESDKI